MIRFQHVSLSFLQRVVFQDVDWLIPEGSRVGLVGDNGAGKTTLMRMILGEVQPDNGAVETPKNHSIGYLPQDLQELEPIPLHLYIKKKTGMLELEEAVRALEAEIANMAHDHPDYPAALKRYEAAREAFQVRDGYAFDGRIGRVLKGLGFRQGDAEKNCVEFSGGWKMRISLAVIVLQSPDIMLLDEPTNHLDTESMEWLESYLKDYRGTLMVVSHDRMFLDKMVGRTAEVFRGKVTVYKGNYTYFLKEKEKQIELLRKEREMQRSEIKRIEAFVERFRYKATKAAQVQSRLKMLEKFELIPDEEKAANVRIRFPESTRSVREVIVADAVRKSYGPIQVFDELSFLVSRGDRIALVGVNGAGKSTLSRLLSGVETPDGGAIHWGENVKLAFFSQESAANLDYDCTVWEEVRNVLGPADDQQRRNLLGAFLFGGDDIHKKVSVLSGGEKSRLALLKVLLQNTNCLILDEPTNHLDQKTKDIFQQALLGYSGTVLIVSHDRYFLDRLVTRVFELRERRLHEYSGNYSYFIEKRAALLAREEAAAAAVVTPAAAAEEPGEPAERQPQYKSKEQKRQEAEERNRVSRLRREITARLQPVEAEIAALEARKAEYEKQLCDPEFLRDSAAVRAVMAERKQSEPRLKELLAQWEELMLEMEEVGRERNGDQ